MKEKITSEKQRCRNCGGRLERRTHTKKPKRTRSGYYFEWWFRCVECRYLYMVDEAKRFFDSDPQKDLFDRTSAAQFLNRGFREMR